MKIHRRQFLGMVGAAAAAGCAAGDDPPEGDDSDVRVDDPRSPVPDAAWAGVGAAAGDAFPAGVQAGDPTPAALRLWTCYLGEGALTLHVALWDGATWQATESVPVDVEDGGFVHVDLEDLGADVHVAYQFTDDQGGRSPVGRAVTALDPDATGALRIGLGSCFHQEHVGFPSLTRVAELGVDAFVFLGDTAYFDSRTDREGFRALYRSNLGAEGFREILTSAAAIYTWDDHEVDNNFNADRIDPDRYALGLAAFTEATPVRLDPPGQIWRRLRWGRTAELFVLDCRSERSPSREQYLSPEQLAWLIDGIKASPCRYKLVANSVPILAMEHSLWNVNLNDRWEGYPTDRQALLDAIADVPGVVFLSGDVHCPILGRVEAEGAGSWAWDVVAGPGGSFLNPIGTVLLGTPNVLWADAVHNAAVLDLATHGPMRVRFLDEQGTVLCDATLTDTGEVVSLETLEAADGT